MQLKSNLKILKVFLHDKCQFIRDLFCFLLLVIYHSSVIYMMPFEWTDLLTD